MTAATEVREVMRIAPVCPERHATPSSDPPPDPPRRLPWHDHPMSEISFGVYIVPRGPDHGRDLLLRMEDTEFDTAWVGDTLGDWQDRAAPLLDSWVTLGAMAAETEEIELYDLNTDPFQLDNRATDPAYAALRAELAQALDALLAE